MYKSLYLSTLRPHLSNKYILCYSIFKKKNTNKICFIYILIDLSIEYQYVGCFVRENAMLLNKNFELINTNTPRVCSEICYNAAYQFAGVTGYVLYDFIIYDKLIIMIIITIIVLV